MWAMVTRSSREISLEHWNSRLYKVRALFSGHIYAKNGIAVYPEMCHSSKRPLDVHLLSGLNSLALVLQAKNAGVRTPGNEATCIPDSLCTNIFPQSQQ